MDAIMNLRDASFRGVSLSMTNQAADLDDHHRFPRDLEKSCLSCSWSVRSS